MAAFKKLTQKIIEPVRLGRLIADTKYYPIGKENDKSRLTDAEITEMHYGFFRDKKTLYLSGDYFLDLTTVKAAFCTLADVSYIEKPTHKDYETGQHKSIDNIQTFFFRKYFLVTDEDNGHGKEHDITKNLLKAGAFLKAHASHREQYRIFNKNKVLQKFDRGPVPKDLFNPIKFEINQFFFNDEYWIDDFYLDTNIEIRPNPKIS